MPKAFTAMHSDLSGPTNPRSILSPQFLALKQALDRGDDQENILQALSDWFSTRGVTGVEAILELEPDAALSALVDKIGGGLDPARLPRTVLDTLNRTVQALAQRHISKREGELEAERGRLASMRQRFQIESAEKIVDRLLA